jgi:hypothetical protein
MRHLHEDARAVARVDLTTNRAAMIEVHQNLQCVRYDRVRLASLDVHNKADPTRVVLELRVVKPLLGGRPEADGLTLILIVLTLVHRYVHAC